MWFACQSPAQYNLDGFVVPSSRCLNCYRNKINVCVVVMDMYLVVLIVAAWFAAVPASTVVSLRWNSANVAGTVTSQAIGFPRDHGKSVAPSGRFPLVRDSPTGSLATGICARLMALHITCHCCLSLLRLHDNPWSSLASTSLPHRQVCGSHVRIPSRYPTATRIIPSLSLSSTDVIDGARSQSPACRYDAARMRALSKSVVRRVHISASWWSTTSRSHTFCICCDSAGGTVARDKVVQQVMAWFVSPSGMLDNVDGRMEFWSSSVDAAEAMKAEGAIVTALLVPKPPALTGRLAYDYWKSSRSTFNIFVSLSLRTASNLFNSGLSLQGDVIRVYNNLGMLTSELRRNLLLLLLLLLLLIVNNNNINNNNNIDNARLLAVKADHGSEWIFALPISACGLHICNEAVRIAICLRLGLNICEPLLLPLQWSSWR